LTEGQGAGSAVSQAQKALVSSTQAVAQAQSEGANVDVLMVTLTQAAELLSRAQLANSAGDYSTANDYASQCQSKLNGVVGEASSLQQAAASQKNQSSIFTILTLLVSAALLVSGVVSWFVLNKRERRSITDGSKSL
jgi:1,4-dihydroxy-2-naphthoate octaprenyltransferase